MRADRAVEPTRSENITGLGGARRRLPVRLGYSARSLRQRREIRPLKKA